MRGKQAIGTLSVPCHADSRSQEPELAYLFQEKVDKESIEGGSPDSVKGLMDGQQWR